MLEVALMYFIIILGVSKKLPAELIVVNICDLQIKASVHSLPSFEVYNFGFFFDRLTVSLIEYMRFLFIKISEVDCINFFAAIQKLVKCKRKAE